MQPDRTFITALLFSKGVPFVAWGMPATSEVFFLIQKDKTVQEHNFDALRTETGFVIAPFQSWKTGQLFFIKPDIFFAESRFRQFQNEIETLPRNPIGFGPSNKPMSKTQYLQKARYFIEKLKKNEVRKAVLTRYLYFPFEKTTAAIPSFFNALTRQYPDAFTYIFHLPGHGVWTGATPETLLTKHKDHYETVSLAGTQLHAPNITWGTKELEEQEFVTRYIQQQLHASGLIHYDQSPVETVKAGRLAHLKTTFTLEHRFLKDKVVELIKLLHPTPAVGGLPKSKALALIQKIEMHDRRFYTGFLGPWLPQRGVQSLFVNLRCAEWHNNALGIYVGGGLTAESTPENEWQETVNKAETLLAVAKKIRPLRHDIG